MSKTIPIVCPLCSGRKTKVVQQMHMRNLACAYRRKLDVVVDAVVDLLDYTDCLDCGLLFFTPPITGDVRFYADLQKFSWYDPANKHEFDIAKKYIRLDNAVLEIGAGG